MTQLRPRVLSEEANERIFREQIVPQHLTGPPAQERPLLVIIGGQTGAGKTAATTMVKRVLGAAGGFVDIDMDLYNSRHPAFGRWQAADPVQASKLVRPDGERWWVKAQDHAIDNRMHVVLQSAMRYPSEFEDVARRFRDGGYRVEVALVAVPESVSRLGILQRYWQEVLDSGQGRRVDPTVHDETYRGVIRGAAAVDAGGLVDAACGLRRDGTGVYVNQVDTTGVWQRPPGLAPAIDTERSRPFDPHENVWFAQSVSTLYARLPPEWHSELAAIKRAASLPIAHDVEASYEAAKAQRLARVGYPFPARAIPPGSAPPARSPASAPSDPSLERD